MKNASYERVKRIEELILSITTKLFRIDQLNIDTLFNTFFIFFNFEKFSRWFLLQCTLSQHVFGLCQFQTFYQPTIYSSREKNIYLLLHCSFFHFIFLFFFENQLSSTRKLYNSFMRTYS